MTGNIINKTVNVPLYDINRLSQYENKSDIVRKALDIFIEKEKKTKKVIISKDINTTAISFGINKESLEYLMFISSKTKNRSRRYFSFSELLRIALRDFWKIIDSSVQKGYMKYEEKPKGDYLERNGIKIIRIA